MSHAETILTHQRNVSRELGSIAYKRERGPTYGLALTPNLERARTSLLQVRSELDVARTTLGAQVAEIEAWLEKHEQDVRTLELLDEAVALLQIEAQVEGYDSITLTQALESAQRNFEGNPVAAMQAWDAVKQLIGALDQPKYRGIPEIEKMLVTYRGLEERVNAELLPKVALQRAAPLLRDASDAIDELRYAVDRGDEDLAFERRAKLRKALSALPQGVPEAAEIAAKAAKEMRRSDEEIGPQLVLRELELVEKTVVPLIEHVARGLIAPSAPRVVEYAPRLRARLATIAPYLEHDRARRLDERARAVLARIAEELGAEIAHEVDVAEAVPTFVPDPSTGTRIEAAVRRTNEMLLNYRDAHVAGMEYAEAELDFVNGVPSPVTERVLEQADSTHRDMVRFARRVEELASELALLAPEHVAVATMAEVVPVLLRRGKLWRERLEPRCKLANAIDEARSWFERAREEAESEIDSPHRAIYVWPEVLGHLARADEQLASAADIFLDEPEHVAAWQAKVATLRHHAIAQMEAACVSEATRLATANQMDEARRFAEALAEAVPSSQENARIVSIIEGTADAREKAALEIERHGVLIRRCAEKSARAAREAYDAWVAEHPPLVALAGAIVANIDQYRGKYIAGRCSHLGLSLADEPDTIRGDVYQIDYDADVRAQLRAGMDFLDGQFETRALQTAAAAGVEGLCTTTQHYPRDARYHAEIVGIASHTPKLEMRDAHGRVIGTIDGHPYPVPRIVIRAVATTYFVVTPGQSSHLEGLTFEED
jgi:hypothetical protein